MKTIFCSLAVSIRTLEKTANQEKKKVTFSGEKSPNRMRMEHRHRQQKPQHTELKFFLPRDPDLFAWGHNTKDNIIYNT